MAGATQGTPAARVSRPTFIYIPPDLHERLKRIAVKERRSFSSQLAYLLEPVIEKYEREEAV